MSFALRIEHAGGGTSTFNVVGSDALGDPDLPSMPRLRIDRSIIRNPGETDSAEVAIYRDAWTDALGSIDQIDDKFFIEESGSDIFGGRLEDWQFEDVLASVILHGPKADALGAQPSTGAEVYAPQADDSLVKNELLSRVGTVGEGTITQQTASIAFEEAHASPGKSITKLAEATGSETLYQPDFTLDYVDSLGSDRTNTTLAPSQGNLIGQPRIQRRTREDFTHIRVLGSQQGSAQFQAERTINAGTTREKWGLITEREAQSQDRIDAIADEAQSELQNNPEHIEIDVEVSPSVTPSLGDEFTVTLPDYDIDTTLRMLNLTRILDEAGERYRALMSNRRLTRDIQGDQQQRSVDEFRSGNPGQYYALADGDGWDKIGSGEPYEMVFYRPVDTIAEYRAKLRVKSRPYRLPSSDPGHTHDVDVTHPSHNHTINSTTDLVASSQISSYHTNEGTTTLSPGSQQAAVDSYTLGANESGWPYWFDCAVGQDASDSNKIEEIDLVFRTTEPLDYRVMENRCSPVQSAMPLAGFQMSSSQLENETVEFDIQVEGTSDGNDATVWWQWAITAIPEHDHGINDTTTAELGATSTETSTAQTALDPGVNEQPGEQVSNVDIDVGGTTVASGLSAPINQTVDIAGQISDGANDIVATTDTLGELRITVEYEGLKNANK